MSELTSLFDTMPQNIAQHIRQIYEDGELTGEATCKDGLQVQVEGRREVQRDAMHLVGLLHFLRRFRS